MKVFKKLTRKLLPYLPESLRYNIMRSKLNLTMTWPDQLEIKLAETEFELERAYHLLHDAYVESGYMEPNETGMRILAQHLLPQTSTVIAKWDGKIVGTVSLIRDNPLDLPLEKIFDLSARRERAQRIAEVSSLALDPSFRKNINLILFPMFRFIYQYAKDYFGTHEFAIAVSPSMADLYKGLILFKPLTKDVIPYDFVNGTKAVGLYMNFEDANKEWEQVYGSLPDSKNLLKYWNTTIVHAGNKLPSRKYHWSSDPILSPSLLKSFFFNKAKMAEQMTLAQMRTLLRSYSNKAYYSAFTSHLADHLNNNQKHTRWDTQMAATAESQSLIGEVWNVSMEGLCLRLTEGHIQPGDTVTLQVKINEEQTARVALLARWISADGLVGFKVVRRSSSWDEMLENMAERLRQLDTSNSIELKQPA